LTRKHPLSAILAAALLCAPGLALPDTPPPAPAASAPEPTTRPRPHSRKLSPQNIKMKNCSKEARDKGLKARIARAS